MTLRRTALTRKRELRRTPMQPRTRELRTRTVQASKKRRDTGPTPATRVLVLDRAQGCCELCGLLLHDGTAWLRAHSVHHRRPRRAGGDPRLSTNQPSNLLLLCGSATTPDGCHQRVESSRTNALVHGWLLHADQEPAEVPVDVTAFKVAVFLTDTGEYQEVTA